MPSSSYQPVSVLEVTDEEACMNNSILPSVKPPSSSSFSAAPSPSSSSPSCFSRIHSVYCYTCCFCFSSSPSSPSTRSFSKLFSPVLTVLASSGNFLCDYSTFVVIASILSYCFASLSVVFLNRQIFSVTFQFPVFVSFFQQVIGVILYQIIAIPSLCCENKYSCFKYIKFDASIAYHVLPLSFLFVGMVGFSNVCLKYVQVSTYQVARSLTLAFNIILSVIFLKAKISCLTLCACGLVSLGFLVGALDRATVSLLGIVTGVSASLFQAIYTILLKKLLDIVNNDQNVILFYNMCFSSFIFIPVIFLAGEQACFSSLPLDLSDPNARNVWFQLLLSGALGMVFNLSSFFCVRVTTPVTFNVVGYAKACLQSLGGILVLGEIYTSKSLTGIILTLLGSFWYSHTKISENKINQNSIENYTPENGKHNYNINNSYDKSSQALKKEENITEDDYENNNDNLHDYDMVSTGKSKLSYVFDNRYERERMFKG